MSQHKPLTVIESPYRGLTLADAEENLAYAREALADSIGRGECPVASHLLYTQALNDEIPAEREAGLVLAAELVRRADVVAFYMDRGLSPGMYRTLRDLFVRAGGGPQVLPEWQPDLSLRFVEPFVAGQPEILEISGARLIYYLRPCKLHVRLEVRRLYGMALDTETRPYGRYATG